mmetsp:Transcript_25782/g.54891  ORF Transcript_25782/g.54891 Transcript_25782/m.54891 type:complete len:221 (+) Transcript_25782:1032-1694(+)
MGTGTPSCPCRQSGGCSQTILHSGLGQSLGLWQSQSQTGSGHTVLHPVSAWAQSTTHLGLSHLVLHFGVLQSRVLLPMHGSFGQNIAQLGSPQFTLHPLKLSDPILGQRVSHLGTPHNGSQFCSQTGSVQFQAQWGTQLFLLASGTIVGHGVVVVSSFSPSFSPFFSPSLPSSAGSFASSFGFASLPASPSAGAGSWWMSNVEGRTPLGRCATLRPRRGL